MNIVYLADMPEAVGKVAEWLFSEWGHHKEGNTVEKVRGRLELTQSKSTLSIILIATLNKIPIGTASLRQNDGIENRPELKPWLTSVYVAPEHRGKENAKSLINKIKTIAKQQNTKRLYLRTEDKESLYQHLGWTTLETIKLEKELTTIMYIDL